MSRRTETAYKAKFPGELAQHNEAQRFRGYVKCCPPLERTRLLCGVVRGRETLPLTRFGNSLFFCNSFKKCITKHPIRLRCSVKIGNTLIKRSLVYNACIDSRSTNSFNHCGKCFFCKSFC